MSKIKIVDLEVFYCVGVTDEERAKPQRLLISLDMTFDFTIAAAGDRITRTIDYFAVSQKLLGFGKDRSWKLIEKLAVNVADAIFYEFKPEVITVEVKKFAIPQAAYTSVVWTKR